MITPGPGPSPAIVWWVVVVAVDGRYLSSTGDPALLSTPEQIAARGEAVIELTSPPNPGDVWDPAQLMYVPGPPPSTLVDTHDWLLAFSDADWANMQAASPRQLAALQAMPAIDVTNQLVIDLVNSFAAMGALSDITVQTVLSPAPAPNISTSPAQPLPPVSAPQV